jgi:transposase
MDSMTTLKPQDWREARRLRGWELHQQGWSQSQIAAALGVTQSAVSRWIARGTHGSINALRTKKARGAMPRLSEAHRARLLELLAAGAEAYGFVGEVWTQRRIATLIKREFGVSYHRDHIGRLLRQLRWSVQKPMERATQRNDAAIERWREETWPALKKRLPPKAER